MKLSLYILLIISVLSFFSCSKDYITEPSSNSLSFGLNPENTSNDYLTYTDGSALISSIDFEGKREVGQDISFSAKKTKNRKIKLKKTDTETDAEFDIPMGVYKSIVLKINLLYENNENGSLFTINGIYTYLDGKTIPLVFEMNYEKIFTITAHNEKGETSISINGSNTFDVLFKPAYWFENVSRSLFETAELSKIDSVSTLLINKDTNIEIFKLIENRIEESMTVIVK